MSYAADHRDLRVEVHGGPATVPPERFAVAVADAMPRGIGIVTRFTPTPDTSANPLYRVVWDFGEPAGGDVCAPRPPGTPSPTTTSDGIYVAFCRGGSALSTAYGRLGRAIDPDDPTFRSFVRDMTVAVFPRDRTGLSGY